MWKIIVFLSVLKCAISTSPVITPMGNTTIGFANNCVYHKPSEKVYGIDFVATCDAQNPCLWCLDTLTSQINRGYVEGRSSDTAGTIIPLETASGGPQQFVVTFARDICIVEWDCLSAVAKVIKVVQTINGGNAMARIGLGHRDRSGNMLLLPYGDNVFCGGDRNTSIYLHRKGQNITEVINNMYVPGGFGFSNDRKKVYIAEACLGLIVAYKIDCNYDICYGEVVFDYAKHGFKVGEFIPFVVEVDAYGKLVVGNYANGKIYCIDLDTQTIVEYISLPCLRLTCFVHTQPHTLYAFCPTAVLDIYTGLPGLPPLDADAALTTSVFKVDNVGSVEPFSPQFNIE